MRANSKCEVCGFTPSDTKELDCHHIINREQIPNGGYVKENGIILCSYCHIQAEKFYETGVAESGYSVEDLFKIIKSSKELAVNKSKKL